MRLLVIEDHEQTAKLLRRGLNEAGFTVDTCADGLEGLHMATAGAYDALILDVMLPKLDGWMFLAGFRERDRETPALVLSARDTVEDRVRGLSLGADDYLVKPFAFDELLARVRALLRRKGGAAAPDSVIGVADLVLDPARLSARRSEGAIDLSIREFRLLELLVRHEGEVLSRSFIAEQVWQTSFGESNVIDVNIGRLRKKIDDPYERKLLHTVKGRGYVIR